jgi:hypothetical protein
VHNTPNSKYVVDFLCLLKADISWRGQLTAHRLFYNAVRNYLAQKLMHEGEMTVKTRRAFDEEIDVILL